MKTKFDIGIYVFLLIPLIFSSCASVLGGATREKITVTGNVNIPVDLLVDGKSYSNVTLPARVKIKRKTETSEIIAFVPNYKLEKQIFDKTYVFNHRIWLNAFFPGFMWIDWKNSANKKVVQNEIVLEFIPATSEKEISDACIDFGMEHYNPNRLDGLYKALSYFQQAYDIDSVNNAALIKIETTLDQIDYLEEERKRSKAERAEKWGNAMTITANILGATANIVGAVQSSNTSTNGYVGDANAEQINTSDCVSFQTNYNKWKSKRDNEMKKNAGRKGTAAGKNDVHKIRTAVGDPDMTGGATNSDYRVINNSQKLIRGYEQQMKGIQQQAKRAGCSVY